MTDPNHTDPPPISYSSRDYTGIRTDGLLMIPYFLPEWTDHNQTDPGVALLGLFSATEDRLNYYIDAGVQQSALTTALTRKAIVAHANSIFYQPAGPDAATVDLTLTIPAAIPVIDPALPIPAGTQVTSDTGEIFETDVLVTFPNDNTTTTLTGVAATHGTTVSETLAISDGRQNQEYLFNTSPVLDDSTSVLVNAVAWDEEPALLLEDSTTQAYYLERDDLDKMTVFFGDGVHGTIPPSGQLIEATYRVGGGVVGQIGAGAINEIQAFPGPINVTFTNPLASSGGGPHESDEEIQLNAPRNWATQERCVTLTDYVAKALQVSGVGKAAAYANYINIIEMFIAPAGGGTATTTLLTAVETNLSLINMATDVIEAFTATYVDTVITAEVFVLDDYRQSDVETVTDAVVEDLFAFSNREFGKDNDATGDVKFSNTVAEIENAPGVDYVIMNEFRMEPIVSYETWNGDVSVTASTNDDTISEVWTVTFTSATAFIVEGSISGAQPTAGVLGTVYISDDERITLTVVSTGVNPPLNGDYATSRVSKFLATDNIQVKKGEIAQLQSANLNLTFTGGIES